MGAVMRGRRGSPASVALIGAMALALGLAGCGGGSSSQPKAGTFDAKGPITLATGKDTSGYLQSALDKWNSSHPNEQIRLIELPESAEQQRRQMIRTGQEKSDAHTIIECHEGLTVNLIEARNPAGGAIVDDQGKPTVNTPEAKKGLDFLVQGFQNGTIPKEAITYKEEEGRRAFQDGKLAFHRQWPYQFTK